MHKQDISNWGNYPKIKASVHDTVRMSELSTLVRDAASLLARGNGRCYGDAALNTTVYDTRALNEIISIDEQEAIIEAESGVLLSTILEEIVPLGFFLPVTPGTQFITLGGAVAADVHGKNHHKEGCFSHHLIHFDLMDGAGLIHHCSREENKDLFWSTIGGMGMTGIILKVCFRLKKIETAYIRQQIKTANNLAEVMHIFEQAKDSTYTVAWIDGLQEGERQGRSVVFLGEHATIDDLDEKQKQAPLEIPKGLHLNMPFYLPTFTLNPLTVKAFNYFYFLKQSKNKSTHLIPYDTFFYPLDGIHNWNRMYGKKGFTQYQFVLPKTGSYEGLKEVLDLIRKEKVGSFLSVLKLFGTAQKAAINSFPMEGYTLALDFKITPKLPPLIEQLDTIVEKYEGKVYLAKDAFSKPSVARFDDRIRDHKFDSRQQQRLRKA